MLLASRLSKNSPMFQPLQNQKYDARDKDSQPVKAFIFAKEQEGPHVSQEDQIQLESSEMDSEPIDYSLPDNRKIYLSGVPKIVDINAIRRYFEDIVG